MAEDSLGQVEEMCNLLGRNGGAVWPWIPPAVLPPTASRSRRHCQVVAWHPDFTRAHPPNGELSLWVCPRKVPEDTETSQAPRSEPEREGLGRVLMRIWLPLP